MLGTREYTLCSPFRTNAHNSSYYGGLFIFVTRIIRVASSGNEPYGPIHTKRRTFFLLRKFCCGYIKTPYI